MERYTRGGRGACQAEREDQLNMGIVDMGIVEHLTLPLFGSNISHCPAPRRDQTWNWPRSIEFQSLTRLLRFFGSGSSTENCHLERPCKKCPWLHPSEYPEIRSAKRRAFCHSKVC